MISLTFLHNYAPVWLLLAIIVITFAALTAIKLSDNKAILWLVSLALGFLLLSSSTITKFLVNLVPYLTMISFIGFIVLVALVLIAKDLDAFKKPLAIMSLVLMVLIIIGVSFNSFSTLNHLLPNSSDSGLSNSMEQFKDFIYSSNFKEGVVFLISVALVSFFLLKK